MIHVASSAWSRSAHPKEKNNYNSKWRVLMGLFGIRYFPWRLESLFFLLNTSVVGAGGIAHRYRGALRIGVRFRSGAREPFQKEGSGPDNGRLAVVVKKCPLFGPDSFVKRSSWSYLEHTAFVTLPAGSIQQSPFTSGGDMSPEDPSMSVSSGRCLARQRERSTVYPSRRLNI